MLEHIRFDPAAMRLWLLDQRGLPLREDFVECKNAGEVAAAIRNMTVRGAPAIGVAAAWGCVLAANAALGADWRAAVSAELAALRAARPTAVNLAWAVERMERAALGIARREELLAAWQAEAAAIQAQDVASCRAIGAFGASLIRDGDCVLTHCNAGALATAGYGTALGVIRAAWEQGKKISVIADETRPMRQGANLTAYELAKEGIPARIACDGACAHLMSLGKVQIAVTGADRIAANGDSANKIGTLGVAICAAHFKIPFYIAAPLSTIDARTASGADIPIEERSEAEVLAFPPGAPAPDFLRAINYVFDVTPASLISGIITEAGILRPPYAPAIARALAAAGGA